MGERVRILKVDTDANPDISTQLQVGGACAMPAGGAAACFWPGAGQVEQAGNAGKAAGQRSCAACRRGCCPGLPPARPPCLVSMHCLQL